MYSYMNAPVSVAVERETPGSWRFTIRVQIRLERHPARFLVEVSQRDHRDLSPRVGILQLNPRFRIERETVGGTEHRWSSLGCIIVRDRMVVVRKSGSLPGLEVLLVHGRWKEVRGGCELVVESIARSSTAVRLRRSTGTATGCDVRIPPIHHLLQNNKYYIILWYYIMARPSRWNHAVELTSVAYAIWCHLMCTVLGSNQQCEWPSYNHYVRMLCC